jgi:hypothetical protein
MVYIDDVNLLAENVTATKNDETLSEASEKVGLKINTEETKYVNLPSPQYRTKL